MIKAPAPQLSSSKKDAPMRVLKPLEKAAAAAQDCLWQRVRVLPAPFLPAYLPVPDELSGLTL